MTAREQLVIGARALYGIIGSSAVHLATCGGCASSEELAYEVSELSAVAEDLMRAGLGVAGSACVVEIPMSAKPLLIELFQRLNLPMVVAVIEHAKPQGEGKPVQVIEVSDDQPTLTVHPRKPIEA